MLQNAVYTSRARNWSSQSPWLIPGVPDLSRTRRPSDGVPFPLCQGAAEDIPRGYRQAGFGTTPGPRHLMAVVSGDSIGRLPMLEKHTHTHTRSERCNLSPTYLTSSEHSCIMEWG